MKLRVKMLITYLVASGMVLLMIGIYGGTVLRQTVLTDKTEGYHTYTRQLCTSTKLVMADIEQSLFNLYQSVSLAETLDSDMAVQIKRLEVEQQLRTMCQNNSYFTSIVAADLSGIVYFGTRSVTESSKPMSTWVQERMNKLNEEFTLWLADENGDIYLKKTVCDLSPLKDTGLLVAWVDSAQLKSTLGLDAETDGGTGILTKQGNLLLTVGVLKEVQVQLIKENIGDTYLPISREIKLEGERYWLTVNSDNRYGWRIVHLVPLAEMLAVSNAVAKACVISGIIAALIAVILGFLMTHTLTSNVRRLLAAMTEVSAGNFDVESGVHENDEIGELADRFRWMQGRLRESTAQIVQRATEKQQAEYEMLELKYRSLQAQISPHFICNILASINSLALMGKGQDVSRLSVDASQYLRDNMGGAEKKYTSLRAEISYVNEYISIYRAVYGDENSLTLDVPQELLDGRVPNMLLQPLVENALVHGGNEEARSIGISARRVEDRLVLSVTDNGGVISPQVIEAIRQANINYTLTRKMKGFGLRCVLQRLRLLYAEDQSLEIQCIPGKESRIQIDIPWQSYVCKENEP